MYELMKLRAQEERDEEKARAERAKVRAENKKERIKAEKLERKAAIQEFKALITLENESAKEAQMQRIEERNKLRMEYVRKYLN